MDELFLDVETASGDGFTYCPEETRDGHSPEASDRFSLTWGQDEGASA